MMCHLDEDVANAALPEGGVPVAPHDADGLAIHGSVVERLQRTLSCSSRPAAAAAAAWSDE
jgi:hypothetical protein